MSDEKDAISESDFVNWVRPRAALQMLDDQWSRDVSRGTLIRHLMHGQLRAFCERAVVRRQGEKTTLRLKLIPANQWGHDSPSYHSHFWDNGLFDFSVGSGYSETDFACFDVRFDPEVFHSLVLPSSEEKPLPTAPHVSRGAKRKDWWDILWIEMIRRIRAGTLTPKNQADLQEILEDYVRDALHQTFGDSTLKPMASNLFKFLEEIRGK